MNAALPRVIVNRLLALAQQHGETEVCGLVGARHGVAATVYPIANVARDRARRFALDPRQQIDAMRRMRDAGEELFAIYHSHPHSAALPSAADRAEAAYPDALYLIITLNTEGVLELSAFRLTAAAFAPVELTLT